jgi:hypothetical protein
MKVQVTADHIENGSCKIPTKCMIALAIKAVDPTVTFVSVRTNQITVTRRKRAGNSIRQHFAVPTKVAKAIIAFDAGELPKPFSFDAKIIDQIVIPARAPDAHKKDVAGLKKRRAAKLKRGAPVRVYDAPSRIAGV